MEWDGINYVSLSLRTREDGDNWKWTVHGAANTVHSVLFGADKTLQDHFTKPSSYKMPITMLLIPLCIILLLLLEFKF